jgi:hypothetical protein
LPVKLGEGLVLVGGVHVGADGVLGEADFGRAAYGVEHAGDRLVGFDLLALHPQQLSEAAAFSGIDQIIAGWFAVRSDLRLHDRILQHPHCGDAGGECRDVGFGVRHLAHVLGRLLQLSERDEQDIRALGQVLGTVAHGLFSFGYEVLRRVRA